MRQNELRDAYLLANTDKIQTEWDQLQVQQQSEKDVESEQSSQGETDSGSEGSEYDRHDFDKEMKQTKRKSKTTFKRGGKRPKCCKRGSKKPSHDISEVFRHTRDHNPVICSYVALDLNSFHVPI